MFRAVVLGKDDSSGWKIRREIVVVRKWVGKRMRSSLAQAVTSQATKWSRLRQAELVRRRKRASIADEGVDCRS